MSLTSPIEITEENNNIPHSNPNAIDMTERFIELFPAGKKYKTLESLREDVSEYGKRYNVVMSIKNSNYRSIHLWCKHGGQYRKGKKKVMNEETGTEVESARLRQKRTQRLGCPSFIKAKYLRGLWVIDTSCGEHNHVVPTNRNAYSIHRKQPKETIALIKRLLNDGQRVADIIVHLSSIGITNIIKKDIENMQQQLRRKKKKQAEASTIVALPIVIRTPTPEQNEAVELPPTLSTVQIKNILAEQAKNAEQNQILQHELQEKLHDQLEEQQEQQEHQPIMIDLEEEEEERGDERGEEMEEERGEEMEEEQEEEIEEEREQEQEREYEDNNEDNDNDNDGDEILKKCEPEELEVKKQLLQHELQEPLYDRLEEPDQEAMVIDLEEEREGVNGIIAKHGPKELKAANIEQKLSISE